MKYVKSYATAEYEEKKSRFIGEVFPVTSVEEAE
ncbi:MAG TPA: thymidylate synthase, partial [Oribacterium sp.]|nr:thymidylate synthase [Oribacterium sp.]